MAIDRIRIFKIAIYIIATAVILRLLYWQFIAKIETNSSIFSEDILPAARGEILTSDGFPIVTNQEAFLLYAKPQEIVKTPAEIAKIIAPLLISEIYSTPGAAIDENGKNKKQAEIEKTESDLLKKLSNRNLFWAQLARKVPQAQKLQIEGANIKGLGFEHDNKRFYPEASLAAHLLGFVGSDKYGQDTGYFGLEGFYDRELRGKPGRAGAQTDPFGFPILVEKFRPIEPQKGSSLYLTIDRTVQFTVEKKLKSAVEKYGAKSGTIIVMDPKFGSIIALANYPNYNPALYYEFEESSYKNPAAADSYEPGSTFKLIAMSAALDLGLVTPETKCEICTGPRNIQGFEISTWNKKYYPNSGMKDVIIHSDNIGMTFVADKLGIDRLFTYITKFGFGQKTGVDLQDEAVSPLREKEEWRAIDLATASFGQGISVTPIQMISAVSAIANKGKLITPKIIDRIAGAREEKIYPDQEKQVISQKSATQMTEMMVAAVENGEAKAFAPKGYRIAGKTGTSQIPVAGHYDPEKTISSFVGFAPAHDPKFAMLVRFTEPTSSPFGSETAAPTFFEIAKDLFNYWGIVPQN